MYALRGGDAFTLEVTATRETLIEAPVHTNHMWLAPGQPCSTSFHPLRLDELLAG
jgi:hypothetical protein